jgi:energy-coupling factor transporter transmembrane protein EcfT
VAEVTALGFHPGNSVLHRLDVRFKILFVVLVSLTSLKAGVTGLFVLTSALMIALIHAGIHLKSTLKTLRYVFILLLFVFMARSVSVPGLAVMEFTFISVTREGLFEGAMVCWRLIVVIMTGISLILTTRPSEIKAAVEWALNPVPMIPGKRIATMMSLIVRFVPVIFEQAKETMAAQRARAVENRTNPAYRLKMFGIPFLRRIFEKADKLALAMEAWCYSENRTDPRLSSNIKDWLALFGVVCLCLIIIL